MKRMIFVLVLAAAAFVCACSTGPHATPPMAQAASGALIEKPELKIVDGRLTPEVMWGLGSLNETAVSPDGKQLAYALSYCDTSRNKSNAEIYLMPLDGAKTAEPQRLTRTAGSEFNLVWENNTTLLFCRDTAIVRMDINSKKETIVAEAKDGFEGFKLSPDGTKLVYIARIPTKQPEKIERLFDGLDKTTGRINEDLDYRHWDSWVDSIPHIFLADMQKNGKADTAKALDVVGANQPFECPMLPFGGIEQFCFSPDSSKIAYTCRKKTGRDYALSTNSDIYIYDIKAKTTLNASDGIMGYDQNPVFSHDGTKLAWESMERDGYESDKLRLMVCDLGTMARSDYTEAFDYSVGSIVWTSDDSSLLAIVPYRGTSEIFAFDTATKAVRQITKGGDFDTVAFCLNGSRIYASRQSYSRPSEIYAFSLDDKEAAGTKISAINDSEFAKLRLGKVEARWIKTVDGKDMLVWVIYPHDYNPAKKYPALLFCEGGPESMVSQFWSRRWNFETFSGADYFVIAPNRRGCPGFGSEWREEIAGDFAGLCMQDYFQAAREIPKEVKAIDTDRIGACGASFGGFSIYWLAGHNEDHLFKAFLAHDGIFNMDQMVLETEETWFPNWDIGGFYWEKDKASVTKDYAQSPHLFVDKWNTPICVVHSELDYRIVASQGMAAYNAARLRGLDARYLYFPDENHWVVKPQNSLLWYRSFIDWFDRYLKK